MRRRDPRVQARKPELEKSAEQTDKKRSKRRAELLQSQMKKVAEFKERNCKVLMEHKEEIFKVEQMTGDNRHSITYKQKADKQLYCTVCNKHFIRLRESVRSDPRSAFTRGLWAPCPSTFALS